ncbi:MAG: porin PorA family protein [Actinomycetota bacterium]
MKGAVSKVLIVLGIVLILAAILWWAIAVNALVKLPDDVDVENKYEGEITLYVDPMTHEPLSEGEEVKLPLEVNQKVVSLADEFDSSTGPLKETIELKIGGVAQPAQEFVYVLDRRTLENVKDDRAYAWVPANVVDREGSYYPLFPFDTSKDESYKLWKNEIGDAVEVEFVNEEEKEGITVYDFKLAFEDREVVDAYVQAMGLPASTTFEELKPLLKAAGVDVDAFLALAVQAMQPADLEALQQALKGDIPLKYFWSAEQELSVDPKTGTPVDIYKSSESLIYKLDTEGLAGLQALLAKYVNDPRLGSAIAQLAGLQAQMGEARKVFSYEYATTQDTLKAAVEDAKDGAGKINLVKVYIPWALLIVGALILIVGLLIGGGPMPEQAEDEQA